MSELHPDCTCEVLAICHRCCAVGICHHADIHEESIQMWLVLRTSCMATHPPQTPGPYRDIPIPSYSAEMMKHSDSYKYRYLGHFNDLRMAEA